MRASSRCTFDYRVFYIVCITILIFHRRVSRRKFPSQKGSFRNRLQNELIRRLHKRPMHDQSRRIPIDRSIDGGVRNRGDHYRATAVNLM